MKHLLKQLKYFMCVVFTVLFILFMSHFFPLSDDPIDKPLSVNSQAVLCGEMDSTIITMYGEDQTAIALCY